MRRTPLALDGIGIDIVTRETILCGDEIGRNALRHEEGREIDRRVHVPGTARHAHADARHAFHAAGDDDIVRSRLDLAGREVDGIKTRGAEARDLHARRPVGITGLEGGGFRDHRAGIHDRIDAAHDDVVDSRGVEPIAVADGFQCLGSKANGGHLMQAAILLAASARGADMVVDINVGHKLSPCGVFTANLLRMLPQPVPSWCPRRFRCGPCAAPFPA
ncbi:hypothetical protein D3C80_871080 [compost metagenome]